MLSLLRWLVWFSWRAFLPLFAAAWAAGHYGRELPLSSALDASLAASPVQAPTHERPFEHDFRGGRYLVTPRAEYSLRGLIVTHNNVTAIDDIYHSSRSVDVRDICVVWGDTALSGAFRDVTYWSEPWTCNYQFRERIPDEFSEDELSNNHLLPADEKIARAISNTHIGDQVELDGMLVDYFPVGASEAVRHSSLVRTDRGNGACEVVYVEQFRVIKRSHESLWLANLLCRRLGWAALTTALILSLIVPYLEYRAMG